MVGLFGLVRALADRRPLANYPSRGGTDVDDLPGPGGAVSLSGTVRRHRRGFDEPRAPDDALAHQYEVIDRSTPDTTAYGTPTWSRDGGGARFALATGSGEVLVDPEHARVTLDGDPTYCEDERELDPDEREFLGARIRAYADANGGRFAWALP